MKYCVNCMEEVNYRLEKSLEKVDVRGQNFEFEFNIAICQNCNEEIYIKELNDENFKRLYDEYKEVNNLLTSVEIKNIREKYSMSQVQFAKLLGFGEKTIARYENGSIQEVSNNILISLMNDLSIFKNLWNKRKEIFTDKEIYKISEKIGELSTIYFEDNAYTSIKRKKEQMDLSSYKIVESYQKIERITG